MRPHIAAIYAFARRADDFADEGGLAPEDRLRLLDDWGGRLTAAAAGNARSVGRSRDLTLKDDHLVFEALAHTIHACALPVSLFEDLLSAFRQDVTKTRYATWAEVLEYCRRSANPVGRLVLRVSGRNRPDLDATFDAGFTDRLRNALLEIQDPTLLAALPRERLVPASHEDYTGIEEVAKQLDMLR